MQQITDSIVDRPAGGNVDVRHAIITRSQAHDIFRCLAGLFSHHVNRATGGIAAKEGALWAAQYLDAGDAVKGATQYTGLGGVKPIVIDSDARIGACAAGFTADSAQINTITLAATGAFLVGHVGRKVSNILLRIDPQVSELVRTDGGNGNRRFLHRRFTLFRGDDDLF